MPTNSFIHHQSIYLSISSKAKACSFVVFLRPCALFLAPAGFFRPSHFRPAFRCPLSSRFIILIRSFLLPVVANIYFLEKKYNLQYSVVRLLLILSRDFRALPASTFCPLPLRFRNRSLTVIVMHPILRSPLYQPSSDSFHCFSSLPFPSLFLFLPTRAVFPLDLSAILAGDTPPLLKFL